MTDSKLNRLTAISSFAFAFFCLLWIVLSFLFLPVISAQNDYSMMVNAPGWTTISLTGLLSAFFGIFTITGLYGINRNDGGFILFLGMILLVLGIVFEFASLTWDIFVWPVICANDIHIYFVKDGIFLKTIQFNSFIFSMLFFLLTGSVLTALGLLKTGKFGKLIPWLLIAGIVLYITGNLSVLYIATAGLCIYSIAFVFIGIRVFKQE